MALHSGHRLVGHQRHPRTPASGRRHGRGRGDDPFFQPRWRSGARTPGGARSPGYLSSRGEAFGERLAEQRRQADERLQAFQASRSVVDTDDDPRIAELGQAIDDALDELPSMRKAIDAQDVKPTESLDYYSGLNGTLLEVAGRLHRTRRGGRAFARPYMRP
ncbi:hypothetical protein DSL92_01840 [Billgrantia gudaonensis]|uniref:Nitrate/nitrite sensing protein domain-containing protein n=1 Tax=Billgrantia gudaonensis TaxID=376427 RepID=A0A432JK94_9GAMM|nr:hypothetical protein DSL92_01840 [Halomonas gudaonensis]